VLRETAVSVLGNIDDPHCTAHLRQAALHDVTLHLPGSRRVRFTHQEEQSRRHPPHPQQLFAGQAELYRENGYGYLPLEDESWR
jgi:hypothetical protein